MSTGRRLLGLTGSNKRNTAPPRRELNVPEEEAKNPPKKTEKRVSTCSDLSKVQHPDNPRSENRARLELISCAPFPPETPSALQPTTHFYPNACHRLLRAGGFPSSPLFFFFFLNIQGCNRRNLTSLTTRATVLFCRLHIVIPAPPVCSATIATTKRPCARTQALNVAGFYSRIICGDQTSLLFSTCRCKGAVETAYCRISRHQSPT